MKEQL